MSYIISPRVPRLYARVAACCAVLLALMTPAWADDKRDLGFAAPESVGLTKSGMSEFNDAMKGFVDRGELSGVVSVVARGGKIVHFENYGMQDIAAKEPMEKDSIFRIYSMTKPIVGVALMTLFEEGKWKLDDPVSKFIPSFKNLKVAKEDGPGGVPVTEDQAHEMTMRELMSHTGGLTYGFFSRSQTDAMYVKAGVLDRNSTLEQMVDKLSKIPLRQQPGSAWHYSVSVDVQGYVAEAMTGKPLDVVLKERIFDPLGMKDTDFWVPEDKASRLTKLYVPGRGGEPTEQPFGEYLEKPGLFSGGGGLASTAMDYTRFAQMLLNGGELNGVRILKPETVKLMHTNQLPDNIPNISPLIGGPGNTFGLDFAIVEDPQAPNDHKLAKGEYWWYGIGGTWFGVNPVQDILVVGMIQSRGGGAARKARFDSKRIAYESIVDPK